MGSPYSTMWLAAILADDLVIVQLAALLADNLISMKACHVTLWPSWIR